MLVFALTVDKVDKFRQLLPITGNRTGGTRRHGKKSKSFMLCCIYIFISPNIGRESMWTSCHKRPVVTIRWTIVKDSGVANSLAQLRLCGVKLIIVWVANCWVAGWLLNAFRAIYEEVQQIWSWNFAWLHKQYCGENCCFIHCRVRT